MRYATITAAITAAVLLSLGSNRAHAEWPNDRPIHLIVGFGPGGGTDIVARIVAQPLSELLHQTVIVENKPGAGGAIAGDQVAKADKDGYTATMVSTGHTVSAVMVKAVRYDGSKISPRSRRLPIPPSSWWRARIFPPTTSRVWSSSPRSRPASSISPASDWALPSTWPAN